MLVIGGVCNQPSAERWLTAVPRFVESANVNGVGLEQLFDDVPVGAVEAAEEIVLASAVKQPMPSTRNSASETGGSFLSS